MLFYGPTNNTKCFIWMAGIAYQILACMIHALIMFKYVWHDESKTIDLKAGGFLLLKALQLRMKPAETSADDPVAATPSHSTHCVRSYANSFACVSVCVCACESNEREWVKRPREEKSKFRKKEMERRQEKRERTHYPLFHPMVRPNVMMLNALF